MYIHIKKINRKLLSINILHYILLGIKDNKSKRNYKILIRNKINNINSLRFLSSGKVTYC